MIDEARLHDFIGKMLGDLGGASSVTMSACPPRCGPESGTCQWV